MTTPTIAKVPGIETTSPAFRNGLYQLALRHGWNVDAIAAVISSESRFKATSKNPLPGQTAAGLLQWINPTAKAMFSLTSDEIARMSAERQLPLVERWYSRTLGDGMHRPLDYYLVGWGARAGLPESHVLATQGGPLVNGQDLYAINASLDVNRDGRITVSDLKAKVERTLAAAGGERIDASPLLAPAGDSRSSSALLVGLCTSLLRSCADTKLLQILRMTSEGPDVLYLRALLGLPLDMVFDAKTGERVRDFQLNKQLVPDGVVGPKTWAALRKSIGGA